MAQFGIKLSKFGKWDTLQEALLWFGGDAKNALQRSMKKEAEYIAKRIRDNLRSGGQPGFEPIRPFTRAIRSAMGIHSRRSGVATGQVARSVAATKLGENRYFSGVLWGSEVHQTRGRVQDVAEVALRLETGRSSFFLQLDKPGKTGKTPRQWLWWLYISGVIKKPPGFGTTHIQIGAAAPRPFVGQVASLEQSNIPQRILHGLQAEWTKRFG